MNQEKGGSKKKSFNYANINLLIFCVTLITLIWGALFAYFKFFKADSMDIYTGIVKDSMSLAEKTASESFIPPFDLNDTEE